MTHDSKPLANLLRALSIVRAGVPSRPDWERIKVY